MADKIFKVRLQLRNDTEANWQAIGNTFIPLAGEACVTNDGENKLHGQTYLIQAETVNCLQRVLCLTLI